MLKRQLKALHLNMIALGGAIGTGIFLASGYAIHTAGPGGALAAYLLIALMVYFLITSLGEMATHHPVTGSFCEYSSRYVNKSFGLGMSYNYWFNWGDYGGNGNFCGDHYYAILVSACFCILYFGHIF